MAKETIREKTKICALNLNDELVNYLSERFDVYNGSLGQRIDVKGKNTVGLLLLPNFNIPDNLHEYEVFIEDMGDIKLLPYKKPEHTRTFIPDNQSLYLYSEQPQTEYNMFPMGCGILKNRLCKHRSRPAIIVVFQSEKEKYDYVIKSERWAHSMDNESHCNYEHLQDFCSQPLFGNEVKIVEDINLSKRLFEPFLNDITYYQTFYFPKKWNSEQQKDLPDDNFLPLLKNRSGDIVSYAYIDNKEITIVLPQTSRKKELLDKVFQEILFKVFSDYFPEVKESAWLNNIQYSLPNHDALERRKDEIISRYDAEILRVNQEIESNKKRYGFLHTILTATGSELVQAMITYLEWLGFENVLDKDSTREDGKPLEEDIQVDLGDRGLLVIEVKGIGGTSTDAECSQIHKIVNRRQKERKAFDVYGLYIVNNELHKEPLQRTIPPFNSNQIKDAEYDEIGLAYTWQLFNLYFEIEEGIFTKEEARVKLLLSGLIDFTPNVVAIGIPYNYYQQHTVVCLEIGLQTIHVGGSFYYCVNNRWHSVKILSIERNRESVLEASNGKYGFRIEKPVPNNQTLYVKKQ